MREVGRVKCEAGRMKAVWELNVLRGVRQALENQSAVEIQEASSSTWLDTR